jgi:amino acid adenylation domain-containing protein
MVKFDEKALCQDALDLVRLLRFRAENSPHIKVFRFLDENGAITQEFSFAELDRRALIIAKELKRAAKPGDRVLLLYPPCLEFIAGFFGCLYAGMIAVPAYPPKNNRHMSRLKNIMDDADSHLALTSESLVKKIEKLALEKNIQALRVIGTDALQSPWEAGFAPDLPLSSQVAFLQYTSGSTGTPKGVMVSHGNLAHNSQLIQDTWGHQPGSVMVSWLPLFHDLGLIAGVLQPVFAGFQSVLMAPATFLQKPLLWLQAITRFKASSCCGPNFAFDYCTRKISQNEKAALDLSSWKNAVIGAEPIRHKTMADFSAAFSGCGFKPETFFPGYGLAESTLQVSVSELGRGPKVFFADAEALGKDRVSRPSAGAKGQALVGCGRVDSGQNILIVDPVTRHCAKADTVGEIWISGPSVALGYWGKALETRETFQARLEGERAPQADFLRTGDLGFISDGELYLTGRCKDLLILRGHNHYPQDLELSVESSHPSLRPGAGAAFSVEREGEERVVLVHEVERNGKFEAANILEAVRSALGREHEISPCAVVLIKALSLPKTSSGKIQRQATKQAFLEGRLDVVAEWHEKNASLGQASALSRLKELLCAKLRLDPSKLQPTDTLQALGLDSLGLVELKHSLDEAFTLDCPLDDLMENPSLWELSVRLDAKLETSHVETGGDFRLTPAQSALWHFEQLSSRVPLYNIATAWVLEGALQLPLLAESLSDIVQRHAALRSGFHLIKGEPLSFVSQTKILDWRVEDLKEQDSSLAQEDCLRRMGQETQRRFDLSAPPLVRARVYQLPSGRHILLLVVHHLVSDGWSFKLLWEELGEIYGAKRAKRLPDLKILTDSFFGWSQAPESAGSLKSLDFWKSKYSDLPPRLQLPSDRPLPAKQDYQGGCVSFSLGQELSGKLRDFSREAGSNPFSIFLAVYQALLYRLTRQRDICVGVPVANRASKGYGQVMGFFVNTMALRQSLDPGQSFRSFVEETANNLKQSLMHQDLPLERLVRELNLRPDPSSHPLFQSLLAFQGKRPCEGLGGLQATPLDVPCGGAKLDLALSLDERVEGFHGVLEYRSDLFDEDTMWRWMGHFKTLLASALENPEASLAELTILSQDQKDALKRLSVGPKKNLEGLPSFLRLFEGFAQCGPQSPALRWQGSTLSYGDLNQKANQLAHALRAWGVGPEVLVAICCERGPEAVVAELAVLKAGGAFLPLDPAYPRQRLEFMLTDSHAAMLLTQDRVQKKFELRAPRVLLMDREAGRISHFSDENLIGTGQPIDLAYVIYTSGTTGGPKGALLTHQGLSNLMHEDRLGISPGRRVLQFASLGFDAAVWEIFNTLAHGGILVLASKEETLDPKKLEQLLDSESVETALLPPSLLFHLSPGALPCLSTVISGGESCPAELVRRWSALGRRLINAYGPTEATVCATLQLGDPNCSEAPPIGRPVLNFSVHVVDERLQLAPQGVAGELLIGGPGLARGYLGRPDLDREKFILNPFEDAGQERLYRSGDLARWKADGSLEYLGRVDTQVKLRGFRIELGEIESALAGHPGIHEAVVLLRETSQDKQLVAYLSVSESVTEDGVRKALALKLPEFMIPSVFVFLERLPLNANGKVDRALLTQSIAAPFKTQVLEAATDSEKRLQKIFGDLLGIPPRAVSVKKSFFSMGGHSLLAGKLASAIQDDFGIKLELSTIFEKPSVASLATLLSSTSRFTAQDAFRESLPSAPLEWNLPSLGQEAFWFFDQLMPGMPAYNMPAAWRLEGPLDLESLRAALGDLILRHPALRTVFDSRDGRPSSRELEPHGVKLEVADLELFPAVARDTQLARAMQEHVAEPFDLKNGPLFKARLYRLGVQEHSLLLNMHHSCADGWSLQVLMNDLKEFYLGRVEGRLPALAALERGYRDYGAWQRSWLEGKEAAAQRGYWREKLAGIPEILELPWDKPRPAAQSFQGASVPLRLNAGLVLELKSLAAREGCTLHALLLTAFFVLLHRLSGQEDLVVGIPVANRRHAELENVVGLFMNTVAIRFKAVEGMDFHSAVAEVKKTSVEAYAHQDLPFERMVEALSVKRESSRQPVLQAMLAFQSESQFPESLGPLNLRRVELSSCASRLDLTLHLQESQTEISGCLEFSSDLFHGDTAKRWVEHFICLLEAAVKDPECGLDRLPLLKKNEEAIILREWNQTGAEYPDRACVHELFEAQARLHPEWTAAWLGNARISYGELNRMANLLARHLRGKGIGRQSLVGLFVERNLQWLVGMLAVLKAGAAYVPLEATYPRERLRLMLEDAAPGVILTQSNLISLLPQSSAELLSLDQFDWKGGTEAARQNLYGVSQASDLAYVIFTSGSTGRPKGVMVEHKGICRLARNTRYVRIQAGETVAQMASHAFDMSTDEIWGALANGAALVILSKAQVLDPGLLEAAMERYGINRMIMATPIFNHLCSLKPDLFRGLKSLVLGGEALDPKRVREALQQGAPGKLINAYGPTECTVWATCQEVLHVSQEAASVPIGRPISNDQAYVLDRHGQPQPVGVPGELYLGGAGLARGYLKRPELSAEKFVAHPFDARSGARLYRTGDLARWMEGGQLDFLGRIDQQVKVSGHRVELAEIEVVLSRCEFVLGAAVVAQTFGEGDKRLVAHVAVESGATVAGLREQLKVRLPDYMVPAHFVLIPKLPLNLHGKVDRKALETFVPLPQEKPSSGETFHDPLEIRLLGTWREVLKTREFGIRDNFFDMGGHSLLAVQLVARIQREVGCALSLSELLQNPTVADLTRLLRFRGKGKRLDSGPLVTLKEASGVDQAPLFLVHPIGGAVLCYAMLASAWVSSRSIYAFESAAALPAGSDLTSLAQDYVRILRKKQAHGPYYLAGWSFGGVLAFEMARILEQTGERTDFLGLFDSNLAPAWAKDDMNDHPGMLETLFKRDLEALAGFGTELGAEEMKNRLSIFKSNAMALAKYQPGSYAGKLTLFLAKDQPRPSSPVEWADRCGSGVEIHLMPGDHYSLLSKENAGLLSEKLSACIEIAEKLSSHSDLISSGSK